MESIWDGQSWRAFGSPAGSDQIVGVSGSAQGFWAVGEEGIIARHP
jgi:hypothetical protein